MFFLLKAKRVKFPMMKLLFLNSEYLHSLGNDLLQHNVDII